MLPPLHAVTLPPAGGGLCNSAFHLIVAVCSLFVAELFTVLLTYILKSQPFQDGRTMCRSVPVSMRGWCRSPLRAARQGGGGGGGEAGAGRHGGAALGGDQGSAVRQLPSHGQPLLASISTQLVLAWRGCRGRRHWL